MKKILFALAMIFVLVGSASFVNATPTNDKNQVSDVQSFLDTSFSSPSLIPMEYSNGTNDQTASLSMQNFTKANATGTNMVPVGKITAGGKAIVEGRPYPNLKFDLNVKSKDGVTFKGHFKYDDKSALYSFVSKDITSISVDDASTYAIITGNGIALDKYAGSFTLKLALPASKSDYIGYDLIIRAGGGVYSINGQIQGHIKLKNVKETRTEDDQMKKDNENAMHTPTEQEITALADAMKSQTISAQVNIDQNGINKELFDNNIAINSDAPDPNTVDLLINATNETGLKSILINLNEPNMTRDDVQQLGLLYDYDQMSPVTNVDEVIHTTNLNQTYYTILLTQNNTKILVSIPSFSDHVITLSTDSNAFATIPEFPVSVIVVFASVIGFTLIISRNMAL